jgi:3-oxoadipate enol-lactonase
MDDAGSSHEPEAHNPLPVPAPSQSGLVPINDVSLSYELFGSGYPLVLVPGEVADHRVWNDQVAAFAARYQVLRYDLRGSGQSGSATGPFSYVADLATLLRAVHMDHPDRPYLVGFLEGAGVAVEYALEYPEQIGALVLVGPLIRGYVPATVSEEGLARVAEGFSLMFRGATPEERMDNFIEAGMSMPGSASSADWPEARERQRTMATEYAQRLLASAQVPGWQEGWFHWRQQAWLEPPAFQRLAEIQVPTLILEHGPLGPDAQQRTTALAQAIANATVVVLQADSSNITMEQPERFNQVVLDFLQTTRAAH